MEHSTESQHLISINVPRETSALLPMIHWLYQSIVPRGTILLIIQNGKSRLTAQIFLDNTAPIKKTRMKDSLDKTSVPRGTISERINFVTIKEIVPRGTIIKPTDIPL